MTTDLAEWIAEKRGKDNVGPSIPYAVLDLIEALAREVRERRDHAADNVFYFPRCRDLLSTTESAVARLLEKSHD